MREDGHFDPPTSQYQCRFRKEQPLSIPRIREPKEVKYIAFETLLIIRGENIQNLRIFTQICEAWFPLELHFEMLRTRTRS